eukprot:gene30308-35297_t
MEYYYISILSFLGSGAGPGVRVPASQADSSQAGFTEVTSPVPPRTVSTWGINTVNEFSDEEDSQAIMQQLSKMKASMAAVYNSRYVMTQQPSPPAPEPMPQATVVPPAVTVVPPASDVAPLVIPIPVDTIVVPTQPAETPVLQHTFLSPVGLTEFVPPSGPPLDPGSQSEFDEQVNNSNLCIVTYYDMAGDPDSHYAIPELLDMVNTITLSQMQGSSLSPMTSF